MSKSLKIAAGAFALAGLALGINAENNFKTAEHDVRDRVTGEIAQQPTPPSEETVNGIIFFKTAEKGLEENLPDIVTAVVLEGLAAGAFALSRKKG